MNTTFIAVWILLIGKGTGAAQQVGPQFADQASCFAVRDSLLYQRKAFKRQCVQVNVPATTVNAGDVNVTLPAPIITPVIESDVFLTVNNGNGKGHKK